MFLKKPNWLKTFLLISFLFFLSLGFRLYGLNWDQGQHLHPDERFLTMVSSSISLPQTISAYFDPSISTLNPYNHEYNFYVYGTFPLLITRTIAEIFHQTEYDQIFIIGRIISAIFDSFTVVLIYLIALKIYKTKRTALLSSLLYTVCIFPIQQSHFYTVDSFTVFFSTLTVLFAINSSYLISGFFFGLTLANKTSIGITLPIFLFFIFIQNINFKITRKRIINQLIKYSGLCLIFIFFAGVSFRIFQPYAFDGLIHLSPHFISNINEAHKMITGEIDYPPNIQWHSTIPVIHPLFNLFFFGLGPITFVLFLIGAFKSIRLYKSINSFWLIFIIIFVSTIFFYHSFQLAKYMRYFYPLYPYFTLISGFGLSQLNRNKIFITLFFVLVFTLAFLHIYSLPHSRYQASEWVCQNVSTVNSLSSEIWDDSLPLGSPSCIGQSYTHIEMPLYDTDTPAKWEMVNQRLKSIDYLVMTSNRLWGSIPTMPQRYPISNDFYRNLFDGNDNFKLIKKFYSYPGFELPSLKACILIGPSVYPFHTKSNRLLEIDQSCLNPGIYFRDDIAEESFTVYDHPQVLIYVKK